jgi:deoxyribonuclease-4
MNFGAHCSTAGGVHQALVRARSIQASVCQLFVKNNMQWFGKPYGPDDLARYANELAADKLAAVFGHTGYLINIAAPPSENRDKSIKSLVQEIHLAESLGLPFLVLHPGAHLGQGEAAGVQKVVEGLNEVFRITKASPVKIALENTAGQGTCLGHQLRHLADIFDRVEAPRRLGLCLDTAHFFEAGYDLRTPQGWDSAIGECEKLVGLQQILAFHLNDSKTDLGSRVDRHAGIGQGKIGREAFRHIVTDPRFINHPGCLETPKSEDLHEDVENLAILRELAANTAVSGIKPEKTSRKTRRPPKPAGDASTAPKR